MDTSSSKHVRVCVHMRSRALIQPTSPNGQFNGLQLDECEWKTISETRNWFAAWSSKVAKLRRSNFLNSFLYLPIPLAWRWQAIPKSQISQRMWMLADMQGKKSTQNHTNLIKLQQIGANSHYYQLLIWEAFVCRRLPMLVAFQLASNGRRNKKQTKLTRRQCELKIWNARQHPSSNNIKLYRVHAEQWVKMNGSSIRCWSWPSKELVESIDRKLLQSNIIFFLSHVQMQIESAFAARSESHWIPFAEWLQITISLLL